MIIQAPEFVDANNTTGTIPKGARAIGVTNIGAAEGSLGNSKVPQNETITFPPIPGAEYPALDYDATGTQLYITIIR